MTLQNISFIIILFCIINLPLSEFGISHMLLLLGTSYQNSKKAAWIHLLELGLQSNCSSQSLLFYFHPSPFFWESSSRLLLPNSNPYRLHLRAKIFTWNAPLVKVFVLQGLLALILSPFQPVSFENSAPMRSNTANTANLFFRENNISFAFSNYLCTRSGNIRHISATNSFISSVVSGYSWHVFLSTIEHISNNMNLGSFKALDKDLLELFWPNWWIHLRESQELEGEEEDYFNFHV